MCCSEQASLGGGGERRELSGRINSGLRRHGRDARDELRLERRAADEKKREEEKKFLDFQRKHLTEFLKQIEEK